MTSHQSGTCRTRPRSAFLCCVLLVAAACLLTSGCRGEDYESAPVSGRVTLNGKPPSVTVQVSFQPVAVRPDQPNPGPGSYAETDADGHYTLRTVMHDAEGAVVGPHKVYLRTKAPEQDPADDRAPIYKEIVPPEWRDGSKTFDVPPEGSDQANFDL